jgi:hypothetical protein
LFCIFCPSYTDNVQVTAHELYLAKQKERRISPSSHAPLTSPKPHPLFFIFCPFCIDNVQVTAHELYLAKQKEQEELEAKIKEWENRDARMVSEEEYAAMVERANTNR